VLTPEDKLLHPEETLGLSEQVDEDVGRLCLLETSSTPRSWRFPPSAGSLGGHVLPRLQGGSCVLRRVHGAARTGAPEHRPGAPARSLPWSPPRSPGLLRCVCGSHTWFPACSRCSPRRQIDRPGLKATGARLRRFSADLSLYRACGPRLRVLARGQGRETTNVARATARVTGRVTS